MREPVEPSAVEPQDLIDEVEPEIVVDPNEHLTALVDTRFALLDGTTVINVIVCAEDRIAEVAESLDCGFAAVEEGVMVHIGGEFTKGKFKA